MENTTIDLDMALRHFYFLHLYDQANRPTYIRFSERDIKCNKIINENLPDDQKELLRNWKEWKSVSEYKSDIEREGYLPSYFPDNIDNPIFDLQKHGMISLHIIKDVDLLKMCDERSQDPGGFGDDIDIYNQVIVSQLDHSKWYYFVPEAFRITYKKYQRMQEKNNEFFDGTDIACEALLRTFATKDIFLSNFQLDSKRPYSNKVIYDGNEINAYIGRISFLRYFCYTGFNFDLLNGIFITNVEAKSIAPKVNKKGIGCLLLAPLLPYFIIKGIC